VECGLLQEEYSRELTTLAKEKALALHRMDDTAGEGQENVPKVNGNHSDQVANITGR